MRDEQLRRSFRLIAAVAMLCWGMSTVKAHDPSIITDRLRVTADGTYHFVGVKPGDPDVDATAWVKAFGMEDWATPATAPPKQLAPDGERDDTERILAEMRRTKIVNLGPGDFQLDWRKLRGRPELARFSIVGAAPATTWQHTLPGQDKSFTRLVFKDAPPHEWLIDWVTPKGQRAGSQQLINLDVWREQPGNGFRFRGEQAFNVEVDPARGLLIRDCSFSCGGEHWTRVFLGKELPDIRGTYLSLSDQYDARLEGVSCWGNEDQLDADKCDRLRVRDWHGGNCARSIVCNGMVPGLISGAHIENVIVSGIDANGAQVVDSNVEIGYWTSIGANPLPAAAAWKVDAGAGYVNVTGLDPRRWIPARSVIRLGGKLLYVEEVDAEGFTFYLSQSHCRLPAMKGDGSQLVRLMGVPYVGRGDGVTLSGWTPNMNGKDGLDYLGRPARVPRPGLPAAAFFPYRTPQIVRDCYLSIGPWDQSNIAVVGGWHEQQWDFGGSVHWEGPTWLRPVHPWVTGPDYGRFDANKRGAK